MKKYIPFLQTIGVLIFSCSLVLTSCSESETETKKDETLRLLSSGTWHISNVTFNNVDETNSFTGMTLTFSKGTYTSSNGEPVWSSSGIWNFTNDDANAFVREDDVEVTIQKVSETALKLTLQGNQTILNGGRTTSVSGEFVFEFNR